MIALRAACLLCAVVLQLAACGRTDDSAARGGPVLAAAAINNPWTGSGSHAALDSSLDHTPSSLAAPDPAPPSLGSPDPDIRLAAMEAWVRSRPDSLHEIGTMLHDSDPSVRTRARELWTAALSGGRKADPE